MSNRELTAQMLFDVVAEHLLAQGKRAINASSCAYRGYNGLKCAIGVVIFDHEYDVRMEGIPVYELALEGLLPARLVPHMELLQTLQDMHDTIEPEKWLRILCLAAERYGLSTAELVPT